MLCFRLYRPQLSLLSLIYLSLFSKFIFVCFSLFFVLFCFLSNMTDLHPALHQVQLEGQGLPHEDIRVVGVLERLLQLL